MKRIRMLILFATVAAALAMHSCVTRLDDGSGLIGTLRVDGPNAYLNGVSVADNTNIYDKQNVSTGPSTSVKIFLRGGGYIQLDENTDPDLILEGACLLLKIVRGQTLIDSSPILALFGAKDACINVEVKEAGDNNQIALRAALHSRINLKTSGRGDSELTVIRGSVQMERPTRVTLGQYDQYFAARGGTGPIRRLTRQQAEATASWSQHYFQGPVTTTPTPPPPPPPPPPPQRIPPPTPKGWCCNVGGGVDEATLAECKARSGRFYSDKQSATNACTVIK